MNYRSSFITLAVDCVRTYGLHTTEGGVTVEGGNFAKEVYGIRTTKVVFFTLVVDCVRTYGLCTTDED